MSWDGTIFLLLLSIAAQSVLLPISFIYFVKVIKPNHNKLFWKVRRPLYFIFYIVVTLLNDITRCTTSLFVYTNIMTPYWYSLVSVPLAYFGGITWGSIRLWLLYHDIRIAKKNQLFLLSKYLITTDNYSIPSTDRFFKMKTYQSISVKVVALVTIFCIITLLIDIVLGLVGISKLLLYFFMLCILLFYTYFILKLCCNCPRKRKNSFETSAFRDDWLLLLELTIIWIVWIIGLFGAFALLPFRGETIYPALIALLTMLTRIIITLTMLILPYKIALRLNKRKKKSITLSTLKKILSTKTCFYAFVEHLAQEFAIENLTFLVEIWQFKYQEKFNLKPSKMCDKISVEIEKRNESNEESTTNIDWLTDVSTVADYDVSSVSISTGTDAISLKMRSFLESMPWKSLPLAQSISQNLTKNDDDNETQLSKKWQQCHQIFIKYLDETSYDGINISYGTRNEIYSNYYALFYYAQSTDDELQNSNAHLPRIQSDEEFKQKIVNVFDAAIHEIVQNLRDSLTRFIDTEQFKLLQ